MEGIKLEQDFTGSIKIYFEHSLSFNGYSYLVIFGRHINGGFIAIPNWNKCTEASRFIGDVWENTERLKKQGLNKETAQAIAEYIDNKLKEREGQ